MRCASALLVLASYAAAGAINTDSAIIAGKGQLVSKVKLRHQQLENDVDQYAAQATLLYGISHKISLIGTFGYSGNSPGPDGFQDFVLRARFKFYGRDEKRATLTFSGLAGVEIPIGERPIGTPDGGLLVGLVGTWERHGWRVDGDVKLSLRPNASDFWRADLALIHIFHETDDVLWQAVLELNYRRPGRNDVLFLAPGLVYEMRGWKFEVSVQVNVWDNGTGPMPNFAIVFAAVHVF